MCVCVCVCVFVCVCACVCVRVRVRHGKSFVITIYQYNSKLRIEISSMLDSK